MIMAGSEKTSPIVTCAAAAAPWWRAIIVRASGTGEIDLVAWDGPVLAFVEVKTRATAEFGAPQTAVDGEKRTRLQYAAREYARRAGIDWEKTRFDIVSVVLSQAAGRSSGFRTHSDNSS